MYFLFVLTDIQQNSVPSLSGTVLMRQHGANWPLFLFCECFSALRENFVFEGVVCAYFLKSFEHRLGASEKPSP